MQQNCDWLVFTLFSFVQKRDIVHIHFYLSYEQGWEKQSRINMNTYGNENIKTSFIFLYHSENNIQFKLCNFTWFAQALYQSATLCCLIWIWQSHNIWHLDFSTLFWKGRSRWCKCFFLKMPLSFALFQKISQIQKSQNMAISTEGPTYLLIELRFATKNGFPVKNKLISAG